MRTSSRIAVNFVLTFGRMLATVGVGLLITRMAFRALGAVDFGVYGAVAALSFVLPMLSAALADGCQRHFAHALGASDHGRLRGYIAISILLFALVSLVFGTGMWLTKAWLLSRLNIPADRVAAAARAYDYTILLALVTVTGTTTRALIQAHERFAALAVVDVINRVVALAAAITLTMVAGDKLIWWAGLQLVVAVVQWLSQIAYVVVRLPVSRPGFANVDRKLVYEMLNYMAGVLLIQASGQARTQVLALVVNIRFGPIANALLSICMQLIGYAQQIIIALYSVAAPAVVRIYSSGATSAAMRLALSTNKLALILFATMSSSIVILHAPILRVWLRIESPDPAIPGILSVLAISWGIAYLGFGIGLLTQAFGRPIVPYSITSSAELIACAVTILLPIVWPTVALQYLLAVPIVTTSAAVLFYVRYESRRIGFAFGDYAYRFLPQVAACVAICVTAVLLAARPLVQHTIGAGPALAIAAAVAVSGAVLLYLFGLDAPERFQLRQLAGAAARKVQGMRSSPSSPQWAGHPSSESSER